MTDRTKHLLHQDLKEAIQALSPDDQTILSDLTKNHWQALGSLLAEHSWLSYSRGQADMYRTIRTRFYVAFAAAVLTVALYEFLKP